ncbi:MAG: DUF2059 domain-containing protein [Gammaproteobacteria bacterium]|nr:DUF2059 domain-containing protein [Gammaproteobacteria bacterium]
MSSVRPLQGWLAVGLLTLSGFAAAGPAAEREAEQLLNVIGLDEQLEGMFTQMVDIQLQRDPSMQPFRGVMLEFFARHFSFASLKPELVKIYAESFTEQELREINAFYSTPTGRKTIELMPELMLKGGEIGEARVRANIGELQAMIAAELARLEAAQANPNPQP